MSDPDSKQKHRKRRLRSKIAKELITSNKFKQRIVEDKHGKKYDLDKMTHRDLVEAIQEDSE